MLLVSNSVVLHCSGADALGVKLDTAGRERVDSLVDIVSLAKDYGICACSLVAKAQSALSLIWKSMYPDEENAPKTFGQLVEAFSAEDDPLGEFSREQTLCSAETLITLAMGHGVQGDLNKVTSEFPKGPDGVEVDLAPFRLRARAFAEQQIGRASCRERVYVLV